MSNLGTYFGCKVVNVTPTKNPVVGSYWIDSKTSKSFIFDGNKWIEYSTLMSSTYFDVNEKDSIEELCKKHTGLQNLKNELDIAQEKFDAYLALVQEDHK